MRLKKFGVLLAAGICSASLLTGCSFESIRSGISERAGNMMDTADDDTETSSETAEKSGLEYDESVEKPAFTDIIGGTVQITMGSVYGVSSAATVENGTITYQWYTNTVNSNGGGTAVAGATDSTIAVDSSAPGTKFYYCVATNEVDGKINKSVSDTMEVIVWDIGTWQEDENGIVRYMMIDGTYPTSTWFMIDENFCYVKEDGNRSTGLVTIDGVTYYFSDEGYLQRNVTGPNGETVDENGVVHTDTASEEAASEDASSENTASE